MNILAELRKRFAAALVDLVETPDDLLDMIRKTQDAKFGDYQANCAMPLGKRLGKPPRDVAADIIDRLEIGDLCEKKEPPAGPGFINLTLKDSFLAEQMQAAVNDPRLCVPECADEIRKTFVIDYSGPNVAKPMHVGHIRSTVIGDALTRTLRFLGHKVIGDNHLGDWGTQFGMILFGYKHFRNEESLKHNMVDELARLYRLVNQLVEYQTAKSQLPEKRQELENQKKASLQRQAEGVSSTADKKSQKAAKKERRRQEEKLRESYVELAAMERKIAAVEQHDWFLAMFEWAKELEQAEPTRKIDYEEMFRTFDVQFLAKKHPNIGDLVLEETAKLHAGDEENRKLWEQFLPQCLKRLNETYDRLHIRFDETLGESFYHDMLAGVVDDLLQRGIARESDGAICIFREDDGDGQIPPMLIRKKDGAFLYATTDLATIQYRMEQWSPDVMLYVVDFRQGLHFEHLFDAAQRWGYENVEFQHVAFGTVMGEDGKPYRTRSGDTVGLQGLLDEAVDRAYRVCKLDEDSADKPEGSELSEEERRRIAETVGIGALKYADLAHNRTSDYKFSYDKMLALNGNTATYMQYAYARVRSIFRKGGVDLDRLRASAAAIEIRHACERALALEILRFSEALYEVAVDYRPNLLTGYLFDDLAKRFSAFFENCPVLKAENEATRDSRLLLCDLTARTLQKGLELLGIDVVEQM